MEGVSEEAPNSKETETWGRFGANPESPWAFFAKSKHKLTAHCSLSHSPVLERRAL